MIISKSIMFFLGGAVFSAAALLTFVDLKKTKKYDYAGCFIDEGSFPLFELDGKVYNVGDLPTDLHLEYLQSQVDAYRRIGDVSDHFASRVASSPERQPIPLKEFLKENWVKEKDVDEYLKSNSNSFSGATQPESLRQAVRKHLEQQKISSFVNEKKYQLSREKRIRSLFPMPCGPESKTNVDGFSYILNGTSGPVPVRAFIELGSQQSRFISDQIKIISETYKKETTIREIFIPSGRGGISEALARGAYCAFNEGQQVYQKYRAAVEPLVIPEVELKKTIKSFSDSPILVGLIQQIDGLNQKNFDGCFKSAEAQKQIDASLDAAKKDGVSSAPAVFINKRRVLFFGFQSPSEVIKELVLAILRK